MPVDEGSSLYEMILDGDRPLVDVVIVEVNPVYERLTGRLGPAVKRLSEVSPGRDPSTAPVPNALCTGARREVGQLGERLREMRVSVVLKPFDINGLLAVITRKLLASM